MTKSDHALEESRVSPGFDKCEVVDFYQKRYAQSYMDEWPIEKKKRIHQLIQDLGLPNVGEAIDFGCGNGVLTNVIKQALPHGWNVYGTDISTIAVENASRRYTDCNFFTTGDRQFAGKKFDFLFTHHVLEHVYNLSWVLDEINMILRKKAAVFHILPCGNEDSFEHNVCLLRKDGVDRLRENRFFFEDEGHLRRLNTEQLSKLYREQGFMLVSEYYSCQYHGAIDWITKSGPSFVRMFTNTSSAIDKKAERKLKNLCCKLLFLSILRYPVTLFEDKLNKACRTVRDYFFLTLGLPLYAVTKPIDSFLQSKAHEEWQKRKTERSGSEMYLYFKR